MDSLIEARSRRYGFRFYYQQFDGYVGREMAHDTCEPSASALFYSVVQKDSVVWDIGANIGYYSMLAALRIDPAQGAVYAFEPETDNCEILTKNLDLNGFQCVTLFHKALGSAEAELPLYYCKRNMGDHRLWTTGLGDYVKCETQAVSVTTIDQMIWNSNGKMWPNIIKMDTQGWEPDIIEGARMLLKERDSDLMLFTEYSPDSYKARGVDGPAYFGELVNRFDVIHILDDLTCSGIRVRSAGQVIAYCKKRGHDHANLLCARGMYSDNFFGDGFKINHLVST